MKMFLLIIVWSNIFYLSCTSDNNEYEDDCMSVNVTKGDNGNINIETNFDTIGIDNNGLYSISNIAYLPMITINMISENQLNIEESDVLYLRFIDGTIISVTGKNLKASESISKPNKHSYLIGFVPLDEGILALKNNYIQCILWNDLILIVTSDQATRINRQFICVLNQLPSK